MQSSSRSQQPNDAKMPSTAPPPSDLLGGTLRLLGLPDVQRRVYQLQALARQELRWVNVQCCTHAHHQLSRRLNVSLLLREPQAAIHSPSRTIH
jgi:hypothetical protein